LDSSGIGLLLHQWLHHPLIVHCLGKLRKHLAGEARKWILLPPMLCRRVKGFYGHLEGVNRF
jgi:hypothetical protein